MSALSPVLASQQATQTDITTPEYNWQYLLEHSLAKRLGASTTLCLPGAEPLHYFTFLSLLRSGQHAFVCGSPVDGWDAFVRQRLHPSGIAVRHSHTGDRESFSSRLREETRLLYWFAPQHIDAEAYKDLEVLHRLSRHYRLPLLADLRQCTDRSFNPLQHGCTLAIGGGAGTGFAWLAEAEGLSWNSGYFPHIAHQEEQEGLCAYIRQQWLSFLHLGLSDTEASQAWQRLLGGSYFLNTKGGQA